MLQLACTLLALLCWPCFHCCSALGFPGQSPILPKETSNTAACNTLQAQTGPAFVVESLAVVGSIFIIPFVAVGALALGTAK